MSSSGAAKVIHNAKEIIMDSFIVLPLNFHFVAEVVLRKIGVDDILRNVQIDYRELNESILMRIITC